MSARKTEPLAMRLITGDQTDNPTSEHLTSESDSLDADQAKDVFSEEQLRREQAEDLRIPILPAQSDSLQEAAEVPDEYVANQSDSKQLDLIRNNQNVADLRRAAVTPGCDSSSIVQFYAVKPNNTSKMQSMIEQDSQPVDIHYQTSYEEDRSVIKTSKYMQAADSSEHKNQQNKPHYSGFGDQLVEAKYAATITNTSPKKRLQQYSLRSIIAQDYKKSNLKLSQTSSMFKAARTGCELNRPQIARMNPPASPALYRESLKDPGTGSVNQLGLSKGSSSSGKLVTTKTIDLRHQYADSLPQAQVVQKRNIANPMLMKAITGAKGRYASYDNHRTLHKMRQNGEETPKDFMSELLTHSMVSGKLDTDDNIYNLHEGSGCKLGIGTEQQARFSHERPSSMTFQRMSNFRTGTFEAGLESEGQQTSAHPMAHPPSRQLTLDEVPPSKVEDEASVLSVGVSDKDIREVKSDSSNHEPMISASSNRGLTPQQDSAEKLEAMVSPSQLVMHTVVSQPLQETGMQQFRVTMGEIESSMPHGLFEFRKEQVQRALNSFEKGLQEEVHIEQMRRENSKCQSNYSPAPGSHSIPPSNSELQASETPPMPTSDKTEPISAEEERQNYLELYKQSQNILQNNMLQYEADRRFLEEERRKLDRMILQQQHKGNTLMQRHHSNKTIFEESERSGTMTDVTPGRDYSESKSLYEVCKVSKVTSKIDNACSDESLAAGNNNATNRQIKEESNEGNSDDNNEIEDRKDFQQTYPEPFDRARSESYLVISDSHERKSELVEGTNQVCRASSEFMVARQEGGMSDESNRREIEDEVQKNLEGKPLQNLQNCQHRFSFSTHPKPSPVGSYRGLTNKSNNDQKFENNANDVSDQDPESRDETFEQNSEDYQGDIEVQQTPNKAQQMHNLPPMVSPDTVGDTIDSLTEHIKSLSNRKTRAIGTHRRVEPVNMLIGSDSDERNHSAAQAAAAMLIDSSSIAGSAGGFTRAFNNTTFNLDNTGSFTKQHKLHCLKSASNSVEDEEQIIASQNLPTSLGEAVCAIMLEQQSQVGKLTPGASTPQVMTSRQQRKFVNKSQTLPPSAIQGIFANDRLQVIPEKTMTKEITEKMAAVTGGWRNQNASSKSLYTAMTSNDNKEKTQPPLLSGSSSAKLLQSATSKQMVVPGMMLCSQYGQVTTPSTKNAPNLTMDKISEIDDLIHEAFYKKQSLNEVNNELLDSYLSRFADMVSQAKKLRKSQKNLVEQLSKINEANNFLEKKNQNLDRDLIQETQRQVDRKIELDQLKGDLHAAQQKVSQICFVEAKEISNLQSERDRRLARYDRRINQLAKDKARLSPHRVIQEQQTTNGNLRSMMKNSQETKKQVEYKATQIVRSQDRLRQSTLASRFKQFSKLSRDFDTLNDSHTSQLFMGSSKSQRQTRHSARRASPRKEENKQTLEHMIAQNKNNRRLNARSSLQQQQLSQRGMKLSGSSKSIDTSQMSLTDFYMSRSQCDASKFRRNLKQN